MTTFQECVAAMKNAAIGDNALVRMFHSFCDINAVIGLAVTNNDERALRLLIEEGFLLKMDSSSRTCLLGSAYACASQRTIDLLLAAGLGVGGAWRAAA
jgi:hypothetical protein